MTKQSYLGLFLLFHALLTNIFTVCRFLDLPWKPKPDSASSAQNHSRGNETLTRKVVQKLEDRERRRSFSKDQLREKEKKSSGGTDSTHDGLVKSPGDHPSLRKRRKSAEVCIE